MQAYFVQDIMEISSRSRPFYECNGFIVSIEKYWVFQKFIQIFSFDESDTTGFLRTGDSWNSEFNVFPLYCDYSWVVCRTVCICMSVAFLFRFRRNQLTWKPAGFFPYGNRNSMRTKTLSHRTELKCKLLVKSIWRILSWLPWLFLISSSTRYDYICIDNA